MSKDPEESQDLDATLPLNIALPSMSGNGPHRFPTAQELAALLPEGAYRVEGIIGQGGMGTVYKGVQVRLKRAVAIKLMHRDQGRDFNFEQRFQREALAMADLNHPNIVNVIDYGEAGVDYLYIVMEFVDGADLMDVIRSGRMTQEMAFTLLPQVCDALQYAHERGIVHRDIKPSNIMLTREGRIKIADFGLAKRADVGTSFVTSTGAGMGTPDYAAPEQFSAVLPIDHRADIYALGVMIYQMLTGHLPRGMWKPPSERAEVAQQWDNIVSHAIQSDPADRYQSVNEIKTDISTITLAEGTFSQTSAITSPPNKLRVSIWMIGVGILLVVGVGSFFALRKPGAPSTPTAADSSSKAQGSSSAGYTVIKIGATAEDLKKKGSQFVQDVEWENGVLVMGKNAGRGQIYDYSEYARDAILRAEVRFDPATSSPQLCLRSQGGEDHGKFYRLWADIPDKTLKLAFSDRWKGYTLLQQWKLEQVAKKSEWTSMELRTIGNQITAVLNGHVLGTFTHDGLSKAGGYQIFTTGRADYRNVEFVILDPAPTFATATKDAPLVNSLGMKFVPVPITGGPTNGKRLLFSIWETRQRDYETFAWATRRGMRKDPDIAVGPDFPVVSVTWDDAVAFCEWLTTREREMGKLAASETYRLPSDHEWSCAVGIGDREDANTPPPAKRNKINNVYPWGSTWPPPPNTGNFWSEELRPLLAAGKFPWIKAEFQGYQDGYATLAPVGSYAANNRGLYDLSGNACEWCSDWYDQSQGTRLIRGSEWSFVGNPPNVALLSSARSGLPPALRQSSNSFRVVLVSSKD